MATENVNIARCTAGRCSHTFEPPSSPPSSYDSVLVVAENVVGVGVARTCAAQFISELISFIFYRMNPCNILLVRCKGTVDFFHM